MGDCWGQPRTVGDYRELRATMGITGTTGTAGSAGECRGVQEDP